MVRNQAINPIYSLQTIICMPLKGISLIAGIIFLAITITATAIIYNAGVPAVQRIQSTAAVEKMKTTLSELDNIIRQVASEGKGSKRTVFISSDPGELNINGSANTITWEIQTDSPVISPHTSQRFGNLIVGSNLETSVRTGNYTRIPQGSPVYIMENSHLIVYINKSHSPSVPGPIAVSSLVLAIYNKDLNSWLDNPGFLDISVDNKENSRSGQGYVQAESVGENLPYGKVTVLMDTTYIDYYIYFTLESGADFLTIEAQEA